MDKIGEAPALRASVCVCRMPKEAMSIWRAKLQILRAHTLPEALVDAMELSDALRVMIDDEAYACVTREEALGLLLALEAEGALSLDGPDDSSALSELRELVTRLDAHLAQDPGLHNVVGDQRAWESDPDHYDFVTAASDLGVLKRFERDLYLRHLEPHLAALPQGAHLLDAGCGPVRFVTPMLERGFKLHLVDASKEALHRALRHGLDSGGHAESLDGHVADVARLVRLADESFDAVLSMEVICYRGDPLQALNALTRVTRRGGLVMLSVEGLYGAMMVTEGASPEELGEALTTREVSVERDVHVTYYTEETLRTLLVAAGLEPLEIVGCHYVPEGPFAQSVDVARLDDDDHRAEIFALEAQCSKDPVLRPLARAWIAIGRRQ